MVPGVHAGWFVTEKIMSYSYSVTADSAVVLLPLPHGKYMHICFIIHEGCISTIT